jgi:hypothetical protein
MPSEKEQKSKATRELTFKRLIDKMLEDKKFRQGISKNPKETLEKAGYNPTRFQITALQKLNYKDLQAVANAFGKHLIT